MTVTENPPQQQSAKKRKHQELVERNVEESSLSDSEPEEEPLQIVVRRVGKSERESLNVELEPRATVLDLKEKIVEALEQQDEVVVPVERQRLIFAGKLLRDDAQSLGSKMKDGVKFFVHLTPLPKGARSSVRTERELSENPTSPREANHLQRARARQRVRRRREEHAQHRQWTDPAAYHPYALDLTSGSLLPPGAPPAARDTAAQAEALLNVAAAQQSVARRSAETSAAQLSLQQRQAAQLQQLLAGSTTATVMTSAATPTANPIVPCPLTAEAATALLESMVGVRSPPPPPVNTTAATATAVLRAMATPPPPPPAAVAPVPALDPTVAALQDLLAARQPAVAHHHLPQPTNTTDQYLPAILDQIAANAGELATTLRLLTPPAVQVTSPPPAAPLLAPPQLSLADQLAMEAIRLAQQANNNGTAASPFRGLPGFF